MLKKSLTMQYMGTILGMVAGTVLLCWFLNTTFLEYYYTLDADVFRPAAWNAFGMDKEGQDYRACAAYGPMYKNIR